MIGAASFHMKAMVSIVQHRFSDIFLGVIHMGTEISGRVRSASIGLLHSSEVKANQIPANRIVNVTAVSPEWTSRPANSAFEQAFADVNKPRLNDYFAGAYSGEELDHDLIDFSGMDDTDLIESVTVSTGVTSARDWSEISDEEFELDELMAANSARQGCTDVGTTGTKGYLTFDASGQIADEKPLEVNHRFSDERLKKIAKEAAHISRLVLESPPEFIDIAGEAAHMSRLIKSSSPELMGSPIEMTLFPEVPSDIFSEDVPDVA